MIPKASPMNVLLIGISAQILSYSSNVNAFTLSTTKLASSSSWSLSSTVEKTKEDIQTATTTTNTTPNNEDRKHWVIGETSLNSKPKPLTKDLQEALETNTHPIEEQDELGRGVFTTRDWRKAWYTYASPSDDPDLIDPVTGYAKYEIEDIEGDVPDDLVGVLYRNGPGKFGVNGDRVNHVLDADGLVLKIDFPSPENGKRTFNFLSRFVETGAMKEEEDAGEFLYRSTFGTGPRGSSLFGKPPREGLNEDPWDQPLLSRIAAHALKVDVKNPANTQIISFGGKLLALFEAGLPHRLDPETLETLGEDDMGGSLPIGKLPVKLGGVPEEYMPENIGGGAHTAHPNVCSDTGNLVGWHWSQIPNEDRLEVTFTEWDNDGFGKIASSTFPITNCELAPHDMALTKNCVVFHVNALKMDRLEFMAGISSPGGSLKMDGQANTVLKVFPRPTAKEQFEPFDLEAPACFSIHFSHGYEDEETGNIVCMFSGWPPSDSKDFLGAWGGFAPDFSIISPTCIWKIEFDPKTKKCVSCAIAPGAANLCAEHPLVHPNFNTKKAKYSYAVASNVIGDSSAPCGYAKIEVEEGSEEPLARGEKNRDIDAYWFGTRYFAGEPLIVPKRNSDPNDETAAYLLGMVQDSAKDRSGVAIFDLEKPLKSGPVSMMWLKSSVPHGLHGCFAESGNGSKSVFC